MDHFVVFFLGVVVAVLGYFLKRWWEGQSFRDAIVETVHLASRHYAAQ